MGKITIDKSRAKQIAVEWLWIVFLTALVWIVLSALNAHRK
jgi:hypothetical protein